MYIILFFALLYIVYISFTIFNSKIYFIEYKNNEYNYSSKLSEVFTLGTHDSLAYNIYNYFSYFAKTNFLNISVQLKHNVRYFDLRFKVSNNKLIGYHSFINLYVTHEMVFNEFIKFLKYNSDQYIIITLRNEEFTNHSKIIKFLQSNYIKPNNLENYFLYNNNTWTYNPTISDLKGKIFVLNVNNINNTLPWADNRNFTIGNLHIYDKYNSSVNEKYNDYISMINKINEDKKNNNIYIFFTSIAFYNFFSLKYNAKKLSELINKYKINKNHILVTDYSNYYI